jgi:hypothetical protein
MGNIKKKKKKKLAPTVQIGPELLQVALKTIN